MDHVRCLVQAPPFQAAMRCAWSSLLEQPGELVTLWPGLWMVGLPSRRRRRVGSAHDHAPVLAVLFMSGEMIQTGQFRAVCDSHQLDHQATAARIDAAQLVSENEAQLPGAHHRLDAR